jgi:O-antigen/teichoic acid export membrane protein
LTKASVFLLIPLYTRFLTPEDYGIVGYMGFMLQIMTTILMFGFYGAQTRFFYQYKNQPKIVGEYLFTINVWLFVILIPGVLLVVFFGEGLYNLFGSDEIPFHPYVPIISWTIFFQIMNQLVISYWVARKAYLKTTILQMGLFFLVTGFAVYFVVFMEMGAEGKLKSMLFGQAVFFLFSYFFYAKQFIFKIKWEYLAFSLSFGIPIVFHLLSGVIHNSIDRAMLADMVTVAELGLYTLGYQVGMVMNIVVVSVSKAWSPNYFELMESQSTEKDYHVCRTYNLWVIVMASICLAGILWGGDVLNLMTPEKFHGASIVIPFVMLGYFFNGLYTFAGMPIFFFKKTAIFPWLTGAAAAVNIGLNMFLIPIFGIVGAALATTLSMCFKAVVVYLANLKIHNHGLPVKKTIIISIAMACSFVGPLYIEDVFFSQAIRVVSMIVVMLLLVVFFKPDVLILFNRTMRLLNKNYNT